MATGELAHVRIDVETRVEIAHPLHDGRVDLSGPLRVAQGNRVVAASDDLFRFARDRASCHLPHARESNAQTRSTTQASAWPKPMHIVAIPYCASRRSSSFSRVAVIRAPVAPSGCPSEIPPPFGLMSSQRYSRPASRANCRTTQAKASFTSMTDMSSQVRPARASALSQACGFPCSIRCGSTPASPNETKRARGSSPRRPAALSPATSTAAAPSQICDEFPAVTFPSGRNAGFSAASASAEVSRRGVSSTPKTTPVCGLVRSMATISPSKRPSSPAAMARRCDSREKASSSSREKPHSSAITSAESPWGTISQRSSSLSERSPPFDPIGTRDIVSTPAETTRSSCPAEIAVAALKFVCMDEPHWRSTVVPHTDSGQPATSGIIRPRFQPCSPICVTQPSWTSSISAGSRSCRATRPFKTCAASSSPRIDASAPFFLPIGERTASMIRASGIHDRVEMPATHTLKLPFAPVDEDDPGAGDQVLDGTRHEHLARISGGRDPCARVDGNPADLVAHQLALACVKPCADLNAERPDAFADRARGPNGTGRPVEAGEEAVAGRVHLPPVVQLEHASNAGVVLVEHLMPATVAELASAFRRAHDVGEQDSGEDAVVVWCRARPRQKLLDLGEQAVLVSCPEQVLVTGKLDEACAGDLRREPAALVNRYIPVAGPGEDERRDANGRKDETRVDLRVHPQECGRCSRARAPPQAGRVPLDQSRILVRRVVREVEAGAPVAFDLRDRLEPLLERRCPRIVNRLNALGECSDEDKRTRALRIRRSEEDGHAAAFRVPEQCGVLRPDCVEDGAHVVHPLLERRQPVGRNPVGHPCPALVEEDQSGERRQALEKARRLRLFPQELDVRDPAGDVDEVERPVADDLVGDVDIATLRVSGLRRHRLPLWLPRRPNESCSSVASGSRRASGSTYARPIPATSSAVSPRPAPTERAARSTPPRARCANRCRPTSVPRSSCASPVRSAAATRRLRG